MGTISSFINVSVDGYFEGPNHDISFFKGDEEDNSYFREQSSRGTTILMGHRTYDMMKSYWPTEQAKCESGSRKVHERGAEDCRVTPPV